MKARLLLCCLSLIVMSVYLADWLNAAQTNQFPSGVAGSNANELKLDAVIISNAGPQRTPIFPILLYTVERGWNRRYERFIPRDAEYVKGEKCDGNVLAKLLTAATARQHWVKGEYGDTELTCYRSDGKRLAIVMNRDDTTAAIESIRSEMATNSIVWNYARLINRTFPPASR